MIKEYDYKIDDNALISHQEALAQIKRLEFVGSPLEWNFLVSIGNITKYSFADYEKIFDLSVFPKHSYIIVCPYALIKAKYISQLQYAISVRSDCKFIHYQSLRYLRDCFSINYPNVFHIIAPNFVVCCKIKSKSDYFEVIQSKIFKRNKNLVNYCDDISNFDKISSDALIINETDAKITAKCKVISKGESIPNEFFKLTPEPKEVNFLEKGQENGNSLEW